MNDTVQVTESTQQITATAAPVVAEQSLEDVYKEAGITVAQPQPSATPAPIVPVASKIDEIPDPYDDKFKPAIQSTFQSQAERLAAIEAHQQSDLRERASIQQVAAEKKLVEDIKTASTYVLENAGLKDLPLSDEAQFALANTELELKAKNDPKFQALWQNRDKNPDAWNKALSIVTKEIGKKFEAKVDPKLAADRQALRATQQSSATTEQETQQGGLDVNDPDFERKWQAIARGRRN